jgi:alpha-beta hydrolase superfamily lysophospholipase
MKHQDGYFKNRENQSIYTQNWLPDNPAKAVLLIIHGLNEHSGRYDHFSNFFVNEGFAVYSMDLVGHGKSDGTRSYVKDFNNYLDDIILYLEKIKQLQPESPIFLIGHSMGGLISALILIDHPDQFAGAVLSGSVVQVPDDVSSLFITLGKFVSFILPKLGLLKIDLSGLSRNPDVVQAYKDDPLVNSGKFTARVSAEMTKSFDRVAGEGSRIKDPVLILHGGSDRIVNPACSHFLYALVSSEIKKIIIYDGFYHEIYNDPGHEQVYQDVSSWINNQLK